MDRFKVEVISQTPNPQQTIYAAMHQDYAENFVCDERDRFPDEAKCGEVIIKQLLAGNRGHYGPLEHPQIVMNCGWFPHSTMQQIRTHRVGISFDVQCLTGDTEVTFVHASGRLQKVTMATLSDLWANGERATRDRTIRGRNDELPGTYRRDCKPRLKTMNLRVLNEETGIFELSHLQEVFDQGIQPVYRVTLEDGRSLDCTEKHRLLTNQGWQTMGEALGLIVDGDRQVLSHYHDCHLMANGVMVEEGLYQEKAWLQEQLEQELTAREIAQKATCSIEAVKKWVYIHHLKLNQAKSGTVNPWNRGLKQAYRLKLTPQQHQQQRERSKYFTRRGAKSNFEPKSGGRKLKAHALKVVQVKYLGLQQTYDLEVAGQWHNFVANGIVVHNSFRYTGQRIVDVIEQKREVEEVFYLRPLGFYSDRQGKKYEYTLEQRQQDIEWCITACQRYKDRIDQGFSEEHARGLIPFDVRQHWVMSANVRSMMHLIDLRWKADAQLEAQQLCECIWEPFQKWVPEIANWYESNRLKKARLAP